MKKEFKAESKQLLELMIHSIYSNKEIFLREIISNASDALDKRHFISLQDKNYEESDLKIEIKIDKENRTISFIDNGIGMSQEELEKNLGTIAHSGSKEFINQLEENKLKDIDVIGQFGVGFYSSFIVANKVEVISKQIDNQAFKWTSDGIDSYEIEPAELEQYGTTITLYLKEEEEFNKYLEEETIEELVKKYSDFVKYPILMEKEVKDYEVDEDGNPQYDKYTLRKEIVTLNSMKAIWKKDKGQVSDEEYENFYMSKFYDWQKPLKTIHKKVEGNLNYSMLLYIPAHKGMDFYAPTYKKQIDLYSKSILIESDVDYLVSDAFKFVKGIIDSDDINLNISREMLQHDQVVSKLAKAIDKKIKNELLIMQSKERDLYNQFYAEFDQQLVFGMYDNFGANKDMMKDLVMYKTTKSDQYVTLKEYVERMPEEQKEIYYVAGSSIEQINKLPIMEDLLDDEREILYFTHEVDEFAINILNEYEGKKFLSVQSADFYKDDKQKEEVEEKTKENKGLIEALQESLKDNVSEVIVSSRLKSNPVALTSKDNISIEMEKTLAAMPDNQNVKASKVLEINVDHELLQSIDKLYKEDTSNINDFAKLLYNQALLIEGLKIEDPIEYSNILTRVMLKASKN
ncbi:molecular chaperone HtpG [Mycoplasma sp. P36-A1]|uniref:molecular chaperone HtpG n=1 Tax=Mycoplasma sp. P36-A1 TaxID=3252900 RepID=UPI003C2BCC5F